MKTQVFFRIPKFGVLKNLVRQNQFLKNQDPTKQYYGIQEIEQHDR